MTSSYSNYLMPPPPEEAAFVAAAQFSAEDMEDITASMMPPDQHLPPLEFPPYPDELVRAVEDGDADRVLVELAEARRRSSSSLPSNVVDRAIECGHLSILRLLADNGVPVTGGDLQVAAKCGHIPILAYLMKHLSWPVNRLFNGGPPLLALAVGHQDAVMWLLSRGADVNLEDAYSETPLSRAVQKGAMAVVAILLDAGADVTRGTPIQTSILRNEGDTTLALMRELLDRGAPVDKFVGSHSSIWEMAGFEQRTALHTACDGVHRNLPAVRLLLAYGANPTLNRRLRGNELPNTSALESAQRRGYKDIASAIQEHMKGNGSSGGKSNL